MKKIFYILTAAIVALGAMACENEGLDNIAPETNGEGLYLTAEISRTGLDKDNMTTWADDDVVTITFGGKTFKFDHQGGGVFFSDDEGVFSLKGQSGLTAWYNEKGIDSETGTAGAQLKAEGGSFDADGVASGFNFAIQNGFVKVEVMNDFKDPFVLTTSEAIFSTGNSVEIEGKGVHYIAIKPSANPVTLSATIGGVEMKNGTVTFQDKKVNNIGQLNAEVEPHYGICGQHQGWNASDTDALYKIPGSNTYARKGVKLADNGFKFYADNFAITIATQDYILLKPNNNWKADGAWFAAYAWSPEKWYKMVPSTTLEGYYYAKKSDFDTRTNVIFCRMDSAKTNLDWGSKWDQTSNLTISGNNNSYTVTEGAWSYGAGSWSNLGDYKVGTAENQWIGKESDSTNTTTNWVARWNDNTGSVNITVTDYSKTYDIYFNPEYPTVNGSTKVIKMNYIVKEHGAAAPTLK